MVGEGTIDWGRYISRYKTIIMKKLLLILLLLPISLFSQKAGLITNSVYNIDTYIIVTNDKLVAKLFVNGIIDNVADDKDFENEAMTFYQEVFL